MKNPHKTILAVLVTLLSLPASAYDFTVGNLCYDINIDSTSVTVTYEQTSNPRYSSLSGTITIPPSVSYGGKTYSVTSIGEAAFCCCTSLTSITIPTSVSSIGDYAFYSCYGLTSLTWNAVNCTSNGNMTTSNLKSVTIGTQVNVLPKNFVSGSKITSVTIPNSVKSIGDNAFYNCSGLTSVTIPNSVTNIGEAAFCGCSGMTSVNIGNSVTSIGNSAFSDCSALTSVTIPNSVITISDGAFINCNSITNVIIGNSVTRIGSWAFLYCSKLTSVNIGNSVKSIGGDAFGGCSGLTDITFPESLTFIGPCAFEYCSGLTKVILPNSVTTIGSSAFESCNHLNALVIGENVASIGERAFAAPALTDVVMLRPRPIVIPDNTFEGVSMVGCDLHVKAGSKVRYELQDVWKDFMFMFEDADEFAEQLGANSGSGESGSGVKGDVNGDKKVDVEDVNAVINIILGK